MDEAAQMIDMEMVDVSLLVSNIINEVALDLEQRHITVVNSLRPKIQLKGNYSLLYSIFRNLTDNAIAYAGTNIHINISCFREDENFFYFSFADTGVGVPPEHLNRLFERFYRVDKGRSRKLGGTGLGLAIVKKRRPHTRRYHLGQEQPGRRIGVRVYAGKGKIASRLLPPSIRCAAECKV